MQPSSSQQPDGIPSRAFTQSVAGRSLECVLLNEDVTKSAPLVFLHEGLGSVALWRDFPQAAADVTHRRSLIYSRYGYGQSTVLQEPFTTRYMHDEGSVTLPALLDALEFEAPILIGHSDGASIALLHAGMTNRPVSGLILMAPHVFVEDISITAIQEIGRQFAASNLAEKMSRYHRNPERTFRGWNDIWLHPDFRTWNIEEYLPAVQCPVLIIQGDGDEYGTLDQVRAIENAVSGPCETHILNDCKHSPHRDQRALVLDLINGFVSGL